MDLFISEVNKDQLKLHTSNLKVDIPKRYSKFNNVFHFFYVRGLNLVVNVALKYNKRFSLPGLGISWRLCEMSR